MKLHESEILTRSPRGESLLTRTAVPGGWLYDSRVYSPNGIDVVALSHGVFVPDPSASVERVVDAVLADLLDRRGFRQTWNGIDADIRQEIRAELMQKVAGAL